MATTEKKPVRKPYVKMFWVWKTRENKWVIYWTLFGANHEEMCQATQGFTKKSDAVRSLSGVTFSLYTGNTAEEPRSYFFAVKIVGPGKKPTEPPFK